MMLKIIGICGVVRGVVWFSWTYAKNI